MNAGGHSLFASDLHLDSEAPWAIDAFLAFLAGPARGCEALYLLGDLFEVWVGVVVVIAHPDFLLGTSFTQRTGVKLLPDPVSVELYGVRTLLSHGDVFCTEDHSYQELRSIVRTSRWQRRFLALPLESRRALASAARAGSKAHTQRTIPTIMDVNADAVLRAFRATGARRLIHGHTHRPAIHPTVVDGVSADRVVLAPWYEAASCVAVDAAGVREVPLPR